MKLKIVLSMIVGLLAINAFAAGVVTQKVTAVADQLPITGDQFQKQINTAVYQLTTYDIPNIIAALNGGATTNAALVISIMNTNTAAFNGGGITNVPATSLTGNEPIAVMTNAFHTPSFRTVTNAYFGSVTQNLNVVTWQ